MAAILSPAQARDYSAAGLPVTLILRPLTLDSAQVGLELTGGAVAQLLPGFEAARDEIKAVDLASLPV